jgi:Effector Associated Constant Component 1
VRVVTVHLDVYPGLDLDPEDVERLVRRLRAEVAELDVESVTLAASATGVDTPAPEGAKGSDAVTLGAMVVALSASGGVFAALIQTVRDWLERQSGRHRVAVTIDGETIELERATAAQQQAMLEAFIRRHGAG